MLIHISSDRIYCLDAGTKTELPFGDLEKHLPLFLYDRLGSEIHKIADSNGDNKEQILLGVNPILVINGPGSFTNIRIGTLSLNALNVFNGFPFEFLSIDKVTWYKILFESSKVKRFCVMYIGQKKNFWLVDLQLGEVLVKLHEDLLLDAISGEEIADNRFIDDIHYEPKETLYRVLGQAIDDKIYNFTETDGEIVLQAFRNQEAHTEHQQGFVQESSCIGYTKMLDANYMIEANVS